MSELVRLSILRYLRNDLNWAALDEQGFSVNKCIGNLFMCRFEDPAESLAGNIHFFRSIGLVESLQVRQADRLKLIDS